MPASEPNTLHAWLNRSAWPSPTVATLRTEVDYFRRLHDRTGDKATSIYTDEASRLVQLAPMKNTVSNGDILAGGMLLAREILHVNPHKLLATKRLTKAMIRFHDACENGMAPDASVFTDMLNSVHSAISMMERYREPHTLSIPLMRRQIFARLAHRIASHIDGEKADWPNLLAEKPAFMEEYTYRKLVRGAQAHASKHEAKLEAFIAERLADEQLDSDTIQSMVEATYDRREQTALEAGRTIACLAALQGYIADAARAVGHTQFAATAAKRGR